MTVPTLPCPYCPRFFHDDGALRHHTRAKHAHVPEAWSAKRIWEAIRMLAPAQVAMTDYNDFYIVQTRLVKGDRYLETSDACHAPSPDQAIKRYWTWLTTYEENERLVIGPNGVVNRRELRWNGLMFEDYVEDERVA